MWKIAIAAITVGVGIALPSFAQSKPDSESQQWCLNFAKVVLKAATDRDDGVSRKAEEGLFRGAASDLPTAEKRKAMMAMTDAAVHLAYTNQNLSPIEASAMSYKTCLSVSK